MSNDDKITNIQYEIKKVNDLTVQRELEIVQLKKAYWDRTFQINYAIDRIISDTTKKQVADLKSARDAYEAAKDDIMEKYGS